MSRFLRLSACIALIIGSASVTFADGPWYDWWSSWHRNNMWPEPYACHDRQTLPNAMNVFVQRGWEKQCLMCEHHFDENRTLSSAGKLHMQYILTQTPPQRRTIYIERGATDDVTKARVDAVQQAVAGMVPKGNLPEVTVSNLKFEGTSSEYVNTIAQKFISSTPTPRLTSADGATSSSNAGSSTSGSSSP